jgi:HD-GYP domain-containing protein (c-di-GMP phosphodiesterase class II)
VLIDVRSSYGRALMVANRFEEARSHTDAAIALLNADSPPALRARVFTRAARVALEIGDLEIARERALIAAPLAAAHSLYEIAASAYSTLYNIAYDIDDDAAASMNYLHRQQDMAIKSGTLRFDLFALFGSYELQAEAGDLAALAQTRGRLELVDTHDAAVELMEGMIPSEALQAAWIGNFDDARRRLAPTAERQGTAVRRSLCWAQIGLYAAAAGDGQRSAEAMLAAQSALTQLEPHETRLTQYGLTLLFLALGALTGNDIEAARRWTQLASDEAIGHARRLCALRAAIVAMIAGCEDADAFGRGVPIALAALRAESFGGMAMLIEALPYPGASPAGAPASVGGVLAGIELCARFATAVRADDASALPAWLETAPGLALGAQARIGNVRSELAAYRRPAPAAIGLIDDVDAVLDTLFEQLDVASPLMAEHSRAVSAWCSRLARTLGLSESEITFITRCGLIHDIGKVRTPPEILDAPRQLTADEWARMRAHTTEGGLIVGRLPLLTPFIAVVRGHHERLDGEGYPDALSANAIPIASRIVAVADCFNAMIGRRPYRPAMPPSQALAELKRHAGSQFDPEVVAAMVQIVDGRLV